MESQDTALDIKNGDFTNHLMHSKDIVKKNIGMLMWIVQRSVIWKLFQTICQDFGIL